MSLNLAPNAPWPLLGLFSLGLLALGVWAYRFAAPPLPPLARRALTALRAVSLIALLWLLAQPVLQRALSGGARLVVLLDRSRSMELEASPRGPSRARVADQAVADLRRAWWGRASVEVLPFAARLAADSGRVEGRNATALGDALAALASSPAGQQVNGVVVVSDGAVNAGEDPAAAAQVLGIPVHAILVGDARAVDRVVTGVEASAEARVGRATPVRVHVSSTEEKGTPIGVTLLEDRREIGRAIAFSPGSGGEATAEFRVTPTHAGLAVWTARVDSLRGEISTVNDSRQIAVEVAPGRIGVLILTRGLNWDLTFIRRALEGDSSLSVASWTREEGSFRSLDRAHGAPDATSLRGQAVVVLDAIAPGEIGGAFDQALADFVRSGGAVLALGGPPPGLARFRAGRLGEGLALALDGQPVPHAAQPAPAPEARELLAWDDDPARGERAWRAAAPLADLAPVAAGAGDRVLVRSQGIGPPLLLARRVGRGQVLLVNGTGLWRWSLSGHDDLTAERGRHLWRGLVHWLAEPVQGEPLRVRPERWITAQGDPVRLFATLQNDQFQPVSGATVEGELQDSNGRSRPLTLAPGAAGGYDATLEDLPPGRYRARVRAVKGGKEIGRATTELGVDRWSLEESRTLPDSATLAAVARASGGRVTHASSVTRWARSLETHSLARTRTESVRLWESPWIFAAVVGLLSAEWTWRRRRGLP